MKISRHVNLARGLKNSIILLALMLGIVSTTQAATTGFNQVAGTYDYNTAGNWVGNTINGIWDASLTNTAAQTVTFGADTALTTGLTFNYAGNNALTLKASASGTKTVTLAGDVGLNTSGGSTANVTLGDAANHLRVDLGGTTRTITIATNRTLTVIDVVTNGAIIKAGLGTLTLNGSNTYTNGTTISAGTVIAGVANALGPSGTITLGDSNSGAKAITLLNNFNSGFSRPITVSNNGTGTVTLGSGSSNQNNPTFTGAITLNRSVTFKTNTGSIDGGISGTGDVTITASGGWSVRFGGYNNSGAANTFTGNIYIVSGSILNIGAGGWKPTANLVPDSSIVDVLGTLNVDKGAGNNETIGALTGNGTVAIGSGSLTVGGGTFTGSATFSGIISGAGTFFKTGTGTQTLGGPNTYSGATIVTNGALLVNGKLMGTGAVTVYSGGTLGGTGLVLGATSVASGGTFSPGEPATNNGIGKFTVSNSVTFASGSIFKAQMTTNGLSDKLVSSGTITNLNATLSLSLVDTNIRQETLFTIMSATNIVGTFNGLPEGASISAGGRRFAISYPGNTNVILRTLAIGTLIQFF